jgi:hypothetical protein
MVSAPLGARPERIVLLTPDHFKRATRAFATTLRDFDTVLSPVPVDRTAARALLDTPDVAGQDRYARRGGAPSGRAPGARSLVVDCETGSLCLWRSETDGGMTLTEVSAVRGAAGGALAWSADGGRLAGGDLGGRVHAW